MTSHATANTQAARMSLSDYQFPSHRLREQQQETDRVPLVLVACGSFSPITFLHMRMFEMASDFARTIANFEVIGGYLSPVSDAYKKAGLAPSRHRVRMCELAAEETSDWLTVDPWEAIQPAYSPTAAVLDHFENEINVVRGGVLSADGQSRRPVKIMLLAGADLISTMSTPGVWAETDLDHILGSFGAMIVERNGTDMDDALANLKPWEENIYVIQQMIQNDGMSDPAAHSLCNIIPVHANGDNVVSSTKIRLLLKRGLSISYLIPSPVIQYIMQHRLYMDEDAKPKEKQPSFK
ncbi:nicotinamide mononucleotide adenylyl transferase [Astrocystis sublimbata]|nr:nicotinamide mononucleotide adenylyl transferase [Astrocystis sublimbata]